MSKVSLNQRNRIIHKIAVLANLMTGALDEIEASTVESLEFKQKCAELLPFCEKIVNDVFTVEKIRTTTYLSDLSNKVDTVIRKNYQFIDNE